MKETPRHQRLWPRIAAAAGLAILVHVSAASLISERGTRVEASHRAIALSTRLLTRAAAVDRPDIGVAERQPASASGSRLATEPKRPASRLSSVIEDSPLNDAFTEVGGNQSHRWTTGDDAERAIAGPLYWPTSQLEFPPLPRSAPDETHLPKLLTSGLPIRLRLYIDALGAVTNIQVMRASDLDTDVVDIVKSMFYETTFLAGKRDGQDVPSYMDIELNLAD